MTPPRTLYRSSLALLTDLYQLTMAYGYWKSGVAERQASFQLFFRRHPFKGGYAVACGLAQVIELLRDYRFADDELGYLAGLRGNDGAPLFEDGFLRFLGDMRFSCDLSAVPEGTVVFAHEPLLTMTGPVLQCQLLETPLLTMLNFQTLIATKAARICQAAGGDPVLEFGLRRAQGADGGVSASRAAYIGGCVGTSNVLAGYLHDIPVKGTHAHSWVMFFEDELDAFHRYAAAMPNNCVFLVDTYDSLQGVRHAIQVGEALRAHGHEMVGIRLDSGDLAHLSSAARELLDQAGFPDAAVVASNDLDEYIIESLRAQGARIGVWGVGTRLATAYDQPALGGVYKLAAVRTDDGAWDHRIKLSEQAIKITNPGILQVRRFVRDGTMCADVLYDREDGLHPEPVLFDIDSPLHAHAIGPSTSHEDLLQPIFERGELCYQVPDVHASRARTRAQLGQLDPRVRRFLNPQLYPVGLDRTVHERKLRMVREARAQVRALPEGGA